MTKEMCTYKCPECGYTFIECGKRAICRKCGAHLKIEIIIETVIDEPIDEFEARRILHSIYGK